MRETPWVRSDWYNDPSRYWMEYIPWVSKEGFTQGATATGVSSAQGTLLYMVSGGASGNYHSLRTTNSWQNILAAAKHTRLEWVVQWVTSVTAVTRWLYLTSSTDAEPAATDAHIGFYVNAADIYASSGDDAAGGTTDTGVNMATGAQFTRLTIDVVPSVACRYYVNGTLVATRTTNIPAAGSYLPHIGVKTSENVPKDFYIASILLKRELS